MLMLAKAESNDQNQEHQREKEGLWDGIRTLNREIQLHDLILNSYIPIEYQVGYEFRHGSAFYKKNIKP